MSGAAGPASELEEGLIASCISIQSYDSVMPREGQNVALRGTGKCDMLSHISTIWESLERPFLVLVMLDFKRDGSAVLLLKELYSNSSNYTSSTRKCTSCWRSPLGEQLANSAACSFLSKGKRKDLGNPKAWVQPEPSQYRTIRDNCALLVRTLTKKNVRKWFLTSQQ